MYAITRSFIRSSALRQGMQAMQAYPAARQVNMKIVPAKIVAVETYDEKNIRMGRELSPHLTIYKPQLTSMLSITHRMTGFALSAYTWALGLGALMSSHDVAHYVTMLEGLNMSSNTLGILKFMIAFPFAYHTCAGIRHLIWDTGILLKIKEVYTTGYAIIAIATVLGVALACL